ncbi:MAG: 1-phosphofructokinase family hexose kinase [Chthonomonas sp.]|nr:1-phosphofructokinase family hexose kinase [Chthonomonas sp.]
MILTLTLNPSVDRTLFIDTLKPGDTNRVRKVETDAGGKGINLSRVATEMGGRTTALGLVGGPHGACIHHVLHDEGVPNAFTPIAFDTRININIESDSGEPPTTFNAPGPEVSPDEWEALLLALRGHLGGATWVAMGGSLPPGVPVDAYRILGEIVSSSGKPWLLDADGDPMKLGMESGPTMVKPNSHEAARLLGHPVESDADAIGAARELHRRLGPASVAIISRGARGAVLACVEGTFLGRSPQVVARSTVGSGDSLLAGILTKRDAGAPWADALQWGLAAGAATATTGGAEIARMNVIELLYDEASVEIVH